MGKRSSRTRLLNSAVVTAAIMSLVCTNTAHAFEENSKGGERHKDSDTRSPIKHVVVIVGENRTFDHIFATYQPGRGEHVDNLLSKGIVKEDGSPGPHYDLSAQYRATDTGVYSIHPAKTGPFNQISHRLQAPGTSYAFQAPYTNWQQAAWDGPGPLDPSVFSLADLAKIEYGLYPQDLHLLYTGATGVAPGSPDSRIRNYDNLPHGAYPLVDQSGKSLYDTVGGSPVHRFFQMWQQLDCSADAARPRLFTPACRIHRPVSLSCFTPA